MLSYGSTLRRHSFIKLTAAQFIPVDTYVVRIMAVYDSRLIWVSYTVRPRAAIWLNKWTGMAPIISFCVVVVVDVVVVVFVVFVADLSVSLQGSFDEHT
mmetsp:Transcript_26352/g.42829  ORF Transcript_26352/g.42829 Transcript_26352/m.42829 type:complete len:99 (+) Transcript_26352:223-519(+)